MTTVQPTETDYRALLGMSLLILTGVVFIVVLYRGGSVQDAVSAISTFGTLLALVYYWYFKDKETPILFNAKVA